MNDVVMVFTSKSLETMELEGGSGNWAASRDRVKRAKWIVATRNKKSGWTQGNEDHGSAFLIGRVAGIKPAPAPESNRFVVVFDRYAELNLPNVWTGSRNPVAYTDLETLGINPDKLEWKDFTSAVIESEHSAMPGTSPGTVIDQARAMIAHALSINPEAVKITVSL
jgi:hypothetical protein